MWQRLFNRLVLAYIAQRKNAFNDFKNNPHAHQSHQLNTFIQSNISTQFGKQFDFKSIRSYTEFSNRVPAQDYESFYPWIEKSLKGEQQVLWHEPIHWFSKSSGTTNAKSKFIPVSPSAFTNNHYKGGMDLIYTYLQQYPKSKLFEGKSLAIGGALSNNPFTNQYNVGDVSALIMKNLPTWAQFARTPSIDTALMSDWEKKLPQMVKEVYQQKVTNLAGVPTWVLVLCEQLLEYTGKKNMMEVWPTFECFFHGAVSFEPYQATFNKLFPSDQVHYWESYNASEGYFGIQEIEHPKEFLLLTQHGVYYEFISCDEKEVSSPIPLEAVKVGVVYEMVVTTNSGLWRYRIGDTIRFTSIAPYRFKIAGRTKHYINLFGEELMVENADVAMKILAQQLHLEILNYTAAPLFIASTNKGKHQWIVALKESTTTNATDFATRLDHELKRLNSDYEAKRQHNLALQLPEVIFVSNDLFYKWLKLKGKLGGQYKVPRLHPDREIYEELLNLMD